MSDDQFQAAADAIRDASVLWVHAGAGLGVDSGLPDFRGPEGFWRAYPALKHLGLQFEDMANPRWFREDPELAWGFYGHRLLLYRDTVPHTGFSILRRWLSGRDGGVFTSNVDGQFQRAGFLEDHTYEVHGSIHHLQCVRPCSPEVWSAKNLSIQLDEVTFRASGDLPTCPHCGGIARPNILMFGDWHFLDTRTRAQAAMYERTQDRVRGLRAVIVELGAGSAVPTVRHQSHARYRTGATLIRINPRESHGPSGTIGIPVGALQALSAIDALLT